MKFLAWLVCYFIHRLILWVLAENGIQLGALPSILLLFALLWVENAIARKITQPKEEEKEEKEEKEETVVPASRPVNTERPHAHGRERICRKCGEILPGSGVCRICGTKAAK